MSKLMFGKLSMRSPYRPKRWTRYVSPKSGFIYGLHGAVSQKKAADSES
jgi:hypothetical protein